jgi:hypothetical protein
VRIAKKGKALGFRLDIDVERLLNKYMEKKLKDGKRINRGDLVNEALKCFLSHDDCVARFKFEKGMRG